MVRGYNVRGKAVDCRHTLPVAVHWFPGFSKDVILPVRRSKGNLLIHPLWLDSTIVAPNVPYDIFGDS